MTVTAPADAVLVVDSVFAMRPGLDDLWDLRVWLDVDPATALARGLRRDAEREGLEAATRLHRDRYRVAEECYLAEVDPLERADVVVDNRDLARPTVLRLRAG